MRSRGLRRSEVSTCSIARSGWPAKILRRPLDQPAAGKARVERERTVDQPDHGADILAETSQRKGGVGEDARVVLGHLERPPSEIVPLRRIVSGSSAQPSLTSRRWQIAAQASAGP